MGFIHKCDGCEYKTEHQEMGFSPIGVCKKGADLADGVRLYNAPNCDYKRSGGFKYIELKRPTVRYNFEEDVFKGEFVSALMAKVVNYQDKVLVDAVIKYAMENGYTDLCLIDEDFVKSALAREILRRKTDEK